MSAAAGESFDLLWSQLLPIGRTPGGSAGSAGSADSGGSGGYRRFAWNAADLEARAWFTAAAVARGLDVQTDRNGNLWAWWLPAGWLGEPRDAFVTGSHLDSVPDGGAFDGPLGVVSALCAIDLVRSRGVEPAKPVAVVVFADEEGARFGIACAGSRLAVGALPPDAARTLTDIEGVTLDAAMKAAGIDTRLLGRDDEALARVGVFIELHIEQGRSLVDLDAAVGIGTGIWPHGRWRFTFSGQANHAGTTRLLDRHDPMLPFAAAVLGARVEATRHAGVATFGRLHVEPNGTNAVPSRVTAWLDARAPRDEAVEAIVHGVELIARERAVSEGVELTVTPESISPVVDFSADALSRLRDVLGPLPELGTGAGHDAGVLSPALPSAMLFVRNPTGISHSPEEFASRADCLAGIEALAAVMADWISV